MQLRTWVYYLKKLKEWSISCWLSILTALIISSCWASAANASDPLSFWSWRQPTPHGNPNSAVAFGNGVFVLLSKLGDVYVSEDGSNWPTGRKVGIQGYSWGLEYGNGMFVATGDNGAIHTSTDTYTWIKRESNLTNSIGRISFANNHFFALSGFGTMSISQDGQTWKPITLDNEAGVTAVAFGNGVYILSTLTGRIFSSPDGLKWSYTAETATSIQNLIFAEGKFVAVNNRGGIWTSADGTNWMNSPLTGTIQNIAYGNGRFVAVTRSERIYTSSDAVSWTLSFNPQFGAEDIAFGNGRFVASSVGAVFSSVDGAGWTNIFKVLDPLATRRGSIINNDLIVATGSGGRIWTSTNGTDWIQHKTDTSENLNSVAFGAGKYVAVGQRGTILSSEDGINWLLQQSGISAHLIDVIFGAGKFVAISAGEALTSTDGLTWKSHVLEGAEGLSSITFGEGKYVISARNEYAFASEDLNTWTKVNLEGLSGSSKASFGNGRFVLAGSTACYFSENGIDWITSSSQGRATVNDIEYAHGQFVMVNGTGQILSSTNGESWSIRAQPLLNDLYSVLPYKDRVLVLGTGGAVLESESFFEQFKPRLDVRSQSGLVLLILGKAQQAYDIQWTEDIESGNWKSYGVINMRTDQDVLKVEPNDRSNRYFRLKRLR